MEESEIKTMFENIIGKLNDIAKNLGQLNTSIRTLADSTSHNVNNLSFNISKLVNVVDDIFHVSEFEQAADELKQLNGIVRYELAQANVTTLLSELTQKIVKISSMVGQQDIE